MACELVLTGTVLLLLPGSATAKGPSMQLLPLFEEGKLQGIDVSYRPGAERPAALDGELPGNSHAILNLST